MEMRNIRGKPLTMVRKAEAHRSALGPGTLYEGLDRSGSENAVAKNHDFGREGGTW
jgi:hypothetical protein